MDISENQREQYIHIHIVLIRAIDHPANFLGVFLYTPYTIGLYSVWRNKRHRRVARCRADAVADLSVDNPHQGLSSVRLHHVRDCDISWSTYITHSTVDLSTSCVTMSQVLFLWFTLYISSFLLSWFVLSRIRCAVYTETLSLCEHVVVLTSRMSCELSQTIKPEVSYKYKPYRFARPAANRVWPWRSFGCLYL